MLLMYLISPFTFTLFVYIINPVIMMKKPWVFLPVMFVLLLSACAPRGIKGLMGRGGFAIDYNWQEENLCEGGISPRIYLNHVPRATRMLEIVIVDIDQPDAHHGEAVLAYTGYDIIRSATLKNYMAPCPRPQQIARYLIRVSALDGNGQVISIAEAVRECWGSELRDQRAEFYVLDSRLITW